MAEQDLLARELIKKLKARYDAQLSALSGQIVLLSQVQANYGPYSMSTFDTVAAMLASNPFSWASAECKNYNPGDDIMSFWIRSADNTRLPNGVDILQTTGPVNPGINVVRIFVRESDGGVVVPGSGLSTYTVAVPVAVPTITDFQNSLFDTDLVWVTDEDRPMAFKKGTSNTDNDGVNGVLNLAGVHYDRMRFE